MKRSIGLSGLVLACTLIACGDGGTTAGASAEPGKSGAPKASAQAKASGAPAASSAAGTKPVEAPKADAAGDILKHMPKDCDEVRAYVHMGKLASGDVGPALESLITKAIASSKDAKKSEDTMKVLKDGGIEPLKAMQELAICANKDDKKTIVAMAGDMTKADKPADVIAKAIETGSGKAPKKEEAGDVTYIIQDAGKPTIAVVGKTKLLLGEDRPALEAAVKGLDGASSFGDAATSVIWVKVEGASATDVSMKEAGDNFDLKVMTKTAGAAKMKADFDKMSPGLDKMVEDPKMSFLKPLLPAAKNAKVEATADALNVTTSFPKKAIGEFFTGIKDMSPKDLSRMF